MQTDSVAETVIQSKLSNTGTIFPLTETVAKLMDNAVDEHRLPNIGALEQYPLGAILSSSSHSPVQHGHQRLRPTPSRTESLVLAVVTVVARPAVMTARN